MLDRVTSPVDDKYNNTFKSETTEPYKWGMTTKGPAPKALVKSGYEINLCYVWPDEANGPDKQHCYVD